MEIRTSMRALSMVWLLGSALSALAEDGMPAKGRSADSAVPGVATSQPAPGPHPAQKPGQTQEARLQEVLPGLWVGGAVAVERMPGWPGANAGEAGRKLFSIVDLRSPAESPDVGAERAAAAAAGVGYLSIPVSRNGAPPASATAQLAAVLANAEGAPVVLHCVSGNRAGDLLARYLIRTGMDVDSAIAKGREVGLSPQREAAIRGGALGHP